MAGQGILWQLVGNVDPLGRYAQGLQENNRQQTVLEQLAGQREDRQFARERDSRDFQFRQDESKLNRDQWQQQFLATQRNAGASQSIALAQLRLAQDQFARGEVPAGFERDPSNPNSLRPRTGGPADPTYVQAVNEVKARPQNLSAGDITKLSDEGGKFQNLRGFGTSFQDRFAGRLPGTGDLQMTAGRYLPAIAGQNNAEGATWWQGYDRYKNQVRNDLFGSALTATEQSAFEKADINPSMNPDQIRKNLAEQERVIAAAVKRKAGALVAGNYNPQQIAAAYGLKPDELGVDPNLARSPAAQNLLRGPQTQQQQAPVFARNPQTGQRIQFLNGQWVPAQ